MTRNKVSRGIWDLVFGICKDLRNLIPQKTIGSSTHMSSCGCFGLRDDEIKYWRIRR